MNHQVISRSHPYALLFVADRGLAISIKMGIESSIRVIIQLIKQPLLTVSTVVKFRTAKVMIFYSPQK